MTLGGVRESTECLWSSGTIKKQVAASWLLLFFIIIFTFILHYHLYFSFFEIKKKMAHETTERRLGSRIPSKKICWFRSDALRRTFRELNSTIKEVHTRAISVPGVDEACIVASVASFFCSKGEVNALDVYPSPADRITLYKTPYIQRAENLCCRFEP